MVTKLMTYHRRPSATTASAAPGTVTATSSASDWGLLLIRLTFGLLMAGHGTQKLFGIFGGKGLAETGRGFAGAHGLWETDGGVEYSVCIAVVALGITATGPGRLAVDRFFRWGTGGWPQAAFALGLGGIAAAITLSL
ncbi:hypothetical protein [Streptomyces lydicus]|uniref:hypothetical protein n=1 Tax=Streptomyces lydicus TaxID=47763 RepID=UPI0005240F19